MQRIVRILKYSAPLYLLIGGALFTYSDLFISDFPWATKWRMPSILIALFLLFLINSQYRNRYKLIYLSYLAFLFSICLMMAGLTWELLGDRDLNRTLTGVLLAIFVVYIAAIGGARVLVLLYLPLILLPVIIFMSQGLPTQEFIIYGNPLALMVTCLVAAQVDENLRIKEFKNRKMAEQERIKADNAYTNLKATQVQLIQSEKMASLGELTAGIAHEIQNPLNFVNNFSEVSSEIVDELMEEIDSGSIEHTKEIVQDLKQNLDKINHHGQRASGIVKGMLEHSRTGDGVKEPTDINKLTDEYLRLAYHGLRAKDKSFNADFKLEADESIEPLMLVPQDIGRVILNLINNAFQAVNTKARQGHKDYKPTVMVKTKKRGDKVEIQVKDNGDGIPDNIKDKIFEPFFTTKPSGEGTGLGLSMSYDIVTKGHGGQLKVESSINKGSKFIIILTSA